MDRGERTMDLSNQSMDLLVFIVNPDRGERVVEHATKTGVLGGTILLGEGTVRNTLLRKLGLDNAHKEIVLLIAPTQIAKKTIEYVANEKSLNKNNHGIAFRTSLQSVLGFSKKLFKEDEKNQADINHQDLSKGAEENMYQALIAIVNQGEGQDVMRVAEKHGATGGTIIRARGAGSAEAKEVFKIQIDPEKDILLIITPTETVPEISKGVGDYLNIDQENTGILFTIDIEETRGLYG